jgi:uncharacterized membrane protein HdeD (DUF308 family)
VASLLRLVAVGLVLLGTVLFVLAFAAGRQDENALWQWIAGAVSFLLGSLLLVFSSAIARALTQDYD